MGKLNLENLSIEEKEKLKEYVNSVKEIKKEITKLIKKGRGSHKVEEEEGGNKSTGLKLDI